MRGLRSLAGAEALRRVVEGRPSLSYAGIAVSRDEARHVKILRPASKQRRQKPTGNKEFAAAR